MLVNSWLKWAGTHRNSVRGPRKTADDSFVAQNYRHSCRNACTFGPVFIFSTDFNDFCGQSSCNGHSWNASFVFSIL